MSLQRAKVNCKRCYNIASRIGISNRDKEDTEDERCDHDSLYIARNEAMRALEAGKEYALKLREVNNDENAFNAATNLFDIILTACKECDYKFPKIADLVDKVGEEIRK